MELHEIEVNTERCIGCGKCALDCPQGNIELTNKKAVVKSQECMKCGHCLAICPKAAISMSGYEDELTELSEVNRINPEELLKAVKSRRSIRHFLSKDIPAELISQIIDIGRMTPTAKNAQNVSYVVIKDEIETIEKTAMKFLQRLLPFVRPFIKGAKEAASDEHFFFKQAPAVILVTAKGGFAGINGSLAASNMALMAESQGLGVLYSGFFTIAASYSFKLRKALGLTAKDKVIAALVLGYPAVQYYRTVPRNPAAVDYK